MGYVTNRYALLLGSPSPSPWAAPLSPTVAQYSCSTANPSAPRLTPSLPSSLALPTGTTMASSSIDIKTCIDEALTLLEKVRTMVEKMAAAEEAKRAAPPDALPPSPCSDSLHTPSHASTLRRHAIFKRTCLTCFRRRRLASALPGWLAEEFGTALHHDTHHDGAHNLQIGCGIHKIKAGGHQIRRAVRAMKEVAAVQSSFVPSFMCCHAPHHTPSEVLRSC
jgi:hypothetical protein